MRVSVARGAAILRRLCIDAGARGARTQARRCRDVGFGESDGGWTNPAYDHGSNQRWRGRLHDRAPVLLHSSAAEAI